MKSILIFQWFNPTNKLRKDELIECIEHNLKIGFDEIIIFNDSIEPQFHGKNIINININRRIKFSDYVEIINQPEKFGAFVVLTNTDIKIDPNIFSLKNILSTKEIAVITRYQSNGQLADNPHCTQDVWVAISQPIHKSVIHQSQIPLGVPGCELRFAEIIFNSGFNVCNPSLSIKNIHIHSENSIHLDANRIYGAYLFTPACHIEDVTQKNYVHKPTLCYLCVFSKNLLRVEQPILNR